MLNASPGPETWKADALSMYQRLLPAEFFEQLQSVAQTRQNNRVYTFSVVIWLMIQQRLGGSASLESAVLELMGGLPASFWPRPCKRLQDNHHSQSSLSSHTGAYNKARQALPLTVVEQSCDRMFEQLTTLTEGNVAALGRRVFFLDGTSVRLAHSEELRQLYPPGSNLHGESHWPLLRMLVAHDLQTGLAMRPQWGAMHGPHAVSEQELLEVAIDRLPSGSVVAGDANFGVFSVAYAAEQHSHPMLLRLTVQRAQRLAGGPLHDGTDRPIVWKPSRDDRKSHPGLPEDACVRGRLIVCQVQPSDTTAPLLLALFTALETGRDEVLKLAIAAYNLVRAVAYLASQQTGIPPRSYSFTRVRNVIRTFAPLIAASSDPHQTQQYVQKMMYYVVQAKLPKRKRKRLTYPRAVWHKGQSFPNRKA